MEDATDHHLLDLDLHLLDESATGEGCLERDDQQLIVALEPGTYYLALDTYVVDGAPRWGEFMLVIMREGE